MYISGFLHEKGSSSGVLIFKEVLQGSLYHQTIRAKPDKLVSWKRNATCIFYKWKILVMDCLYRGKRSMDLFSLELVHGGLGFPLYSFVPRGTPMFPWLLWNSLELWSFSRTFWAQLEFTLFTAQPLKTCISYGQSWVSESLCHQLPLLAWNLHLTTQPFPPSSMIAISLEYKDSNPKLKQHVYEEAQ